jgi:hypothetical protein
MLLDSCLTTEAYFPISRYSSKIDDDSRQYVIAILQRTLMETGALNAFLLKLIGCYLLHVGLIRFPAHACWSLLQCVACSKQSLFLPTGNQRNADLRRFNFLFKSG